LQDDASNTSVILNTSCVYVICELVCLTVLAFSVKFRTEFSRVEHSKAPSRRSLHTIQSNAFTILHARHLSRAEQPYQVQRSTSLIKMNDSEETLMRCSHELSCL